MKLDIRYAAGLFDGEGWATICKQSIKGRIDPRYQLVVGIGMVHKPIIESMKETFGGNVFAKNTSPAQSERTRNGFTWRLSSQPAADFLKKILPHLIVKRDEAELAIEFQSHVRKHVYDIKYKPETRPGLIAYRDEVFLQLRALKRREFSLQ